MRRVAKHRDVAVSLRRRRPVDTQGNTVIARRAGLM